MHANIYLRSTSAEKCAGRRAARMRTPGAGLAGDYVLLASGHIDDGIAVNETD